MSSLLIDNQELMKEWNFEKNVGLMPNQLSTGSNKRVWWRCAEGHEWEATIHNRTKGRGCPYCSGRLAVPGKTDLATLYPRIAEEWHPTKNTDILVSEIRPGSNKLVWWKCVKNHEWQDTPNHRIIGRGCPFCSHNRLEIHNSLGSRFPEIAAEWDYGSNIGTPNDYAAFSNKQAHWICKKCNYHWQTTIANRTHLHSGCPVCANQIIVLGINDLASQNPLLVAEWDYEKNSILPTEVGSGSLKIAWWKCAYDHSWKARIVHRNNGAGCPICSKYLKTSIQEYAVFYYIKKYFTDAINSFRSEELGKKEIDIYIPSKKIGIEYDGQKWHEDLHRDIEKDSLCLELGITLIRIREPNCVEYNRQGPVIRLEDCSISSLEKGIKTLLEKLHCKNEINLSNDFHSLIEEYRSIAMKNNLKEKYPELAVEWHPSKNGSLLPENIPGKGSKLKVYWLCPVCGHEWVATLDTRVHGSGCPVCAGRIVKAGYNDLLTSNPKLASEWHPTKNDRLLPSMVSKGSGKKVWWKCERGHEWQAAICDRNRGTGCPYCSGKKSLLYLSPCKSDSN